MQEIRKNFQISRYRDLMWPGVMQYWPGQQKKVISAVTAHFIITEVTQSN